MSGARILRGDFQTQTLPAGGVFLGYPHARQISYAFHESILRLVAVNDGLIRHIQGVGASAMSLDRARNGIVKEMLASECEWLLMIDTDMRFQPEDVTSLLTAADPVQRPVLGGLCFKLEGHNPDYGVVLIPTMYRFDESGQHRPVMVYQGVERVDVTGAAFLAVHRSVLEKIGSGWFSHHPAQDVVSEDWAFCLRLREHSIPLHVDTRIKIRHSKEVELGEEMYLDLVARMQSSPAPVTDS